MHILAVDDEKNMLENLEGCIKDVAENEKIAAFIKPADALEYAGKNPDIDVAFLDIKMRIMNGLELSKKLKIINPSINIIFCTGYDDYVYEAVSKIRCSGYLLKPVTAEKVCEELSNLRNPIKAKFFSKSQIYIQCFGNFTVFSNNEPVVFSNRKAKELLAYLVDKKGAFCTNRELQSILWEDDECHESYFKKCRKNLIDTLKAYGIENIILKQWGAIAIDKGVINCDYYSWLRGDIEGIRLFNGEYMEEYSWAEITKGTMIKE